VNAMKQKKPESLARFLTYVLGRAPDEFGLVLSHDGYAGIKSVLKVCSEEPGWRHVRDAHIREVMLVIPRAPFDIDGNRIRAKDRSRLPVPEPADQPPKLLFTHVRQKAYPHVAGRGLQAAVDMPIVLSDDEALAERIGRRRDRSPVRLVVNTAMAESRGIVFWQAGRRLYTSDGIPPDCFTGPALPKEPARQKRPPTPSPVRDRTPGSFEVNPTESGLSADTVGGTRKKRKTNRRKAPPWRR